jgi:hypothetical protein
MYKALTVANNKVQDQPSMYVPDEKAREVTWQVLKDYLYAADQQQKSRREFNNRSLISEINQNQKAFNSYVPPKSEDPDEEWRAQTVRPITRNKLISIAAHVTATIIYPNIFAQNDSDEEDKDAAMVMRDLVEFNINNSNYSRSFIQAVISALVDPAVVMQSDYAHVMRKVRFMKDSGAYEEKEILDEVLSGFSAYVIPCNELLISNFYEPELQRQRFLIRNKYIDFEEARIIYGKHANFKYVKAGVRAVYDRLNDAFYDVKDEELKEYLVNEVIYYNRSMDVQLTFINGILVCSPDYPNPRIDKMYPFAKSGYEPLNNGQFFYFKSAANKISSDQQLVDTLYNMILDGTFLQLMPPMALYGSEDVNTSVIIPGAITSFNDPNTKLENIAPRSDLRAGLETIGMVERSISESSQDNLQMGVAQGGERTAREVVLLQQNAKTALGLFGKMVAFLVEDFGRLMLGDILQHMTVGEIDQVTNGMKYRSFLVPNKVDDGKSVTRKIEFTDKMLGADEMAPENVSDMAYGLLDREGGPNSDTRIVQVNPEKFRDLKFKVVVTADDLMQKSKALEKALNLELFDRAINLPFVNQETLAKDFLFASYKPGDTDKYIRKEQPMPQGPSGQQSGMLNSGVNTSLLSQITGSNSLGAAASTDM